MTGSSQIGRGKEAGYVSPTYSGPKINPLGPPREGERVDYRPPPRVTSQSNHRALCTFPPGQLAIRLGRKQLAQI
ncbi:hypothetical protein BC835DRAFT_657434 [Cytidiella melzeri]|nr:hypothetical protein BC835DRAFT_657434 [Cytidiella melzeri]